MPLIFVAFYLCWPPAHTLFQPDSASYLNFSAVRTGGYPLFLASLKPFIGGPTNYIAVQLILYAVCTAALAWQLFCISSRMTIAIAAEALLLGNPAVNGFHFTIMTESVFLSVSAIFLAAAIGYLRRASTAALIVASVAAAYALAIRPTGLIFVPVAILLIFLAPVEKGKVVRQVAVALISIFSIVALEAAYYHAHHGSTRDSLFPIHIFAKSGLIDVANGGAVIDAAPAETRTLHRALEMELAPVRRLIAEAPSPTARCRLLANYETFIQYEFARDERQMVVAKGGSQILTTIGFARIKHAPLAYAGHVMQNLYCLWTIWAATNSEKDELKSYLQQRRPLPFDAQVFASLAVSQSMPFVFIVRPVMWGIAAILAIAGAWVLLSAFRGGGRNIWLSLAGICGLLVHGSLLATAVAGVAIPRYTLGLWVPLCIGVGAALILAGDVLRPVAARQKLAS